MRGRGTRDKGVMPYVPDAVPEAAQDPLLTDYIRRELAKIHDSMTQIEENKAVANTAVHKNLIINGNFLINQRGLATGEFRDFEYTVDRWLCTGDTITWIDADAHRDLTGSKELGIASNGVDSCYIKQIIENFNEVVGETVTLSFWLRGALTAGFPLSVWLRAYNYTADVPDVGTLVYGPVTIPDIDNWVKHTVTFTLPDSTGINKGTGYDVFDLHIGQVHTWPDGTLVPAGQGFRIARVQLEVGAQATPFEVRSTNTEFALCQRYYQYIPGRFLGLMTNGTNLLERRLQIDFSKMRAIPTISHGPSYNWEAETPVFEATDRHIDAWGNCTTVADHAHFYGLYLDAEL